MGPHDTTRPRKGDDQEMSKTYRFALNYDKRFAGPATIVLKNWMTDSDGMIHITPDCFGMSELDFEITRLNDELDVIRAQAAKEFAHKPKKLFRNH